MPTPPSPRLDQPPPPPPPLSTGGLDRINIAIQVEKYWDIIRKRWQIIALFLAVALLFSGYQASTEPDIFLATGSMIVQPQIFNTTPGGAVVVEEQTKFFETQVQLMKTGPVPKAARERLIEKKLPMPSELKLDARPIRGTSIFLLTVECTDRDYAKTLLDTVMEEFIIYKRKLYEKSAASTAISLQKEIDRSKKESKEAEEKLLKFEEQNNMAYSQGQGNLAIQYLVDLRRKLAEVTTELRLLDTETAEQRLERGPLDPSFEKRPLPSTSTTHAQPTEAQGQAVIPKNLKSTSEGVTLKNELVILRDKRADLIKHLKPEHPKIIQLEEEITSKERLLAVVQERDKEKIAAYRQSLVKQQEALQKDIVDWEKLASEANQKMSLHASLKSELDRARELYEILLKRLQEIDIGQSTKPDIVQVNEPAEASLRPIRPKRTQNMLIAVGVGLALSLGIIFLLNQFDDRIRTVDELQEMIPETVLGQIPAVPERKGVSEPLVMFNLPPHNTFSESFRNVRSSFMFSPLGRQAKTIAVTSAIPNDGKTTCSVNLAICLAQIENARTLLIDADMRKTTVHKYFKYENGTGFSELLSDQATLKECIMGTVVPNLDLIRAGTPPPNPGELLLSDKLKNLLDQLSQTYHRIIIDTPPVLATDDVLSLAPVMDGVVFVVKANHTSLRFVKQSLHLLKQRGSKIFGVMLNHINVNSTQYYYQYYYASYYLARPGRNEDPGSGKPTGVSGGGG